jgi:RHS repeat-associated protein
MSAALRFSLLPLLGGGLRWGFNSRGASVRHSNPHPKLPPRRGKGHTGSSFPRKRESSFVHRAKAFLLFALLFATAAAHAAPTVALTAPANNALYLAPVSITVSANASAPAPDKVVRVDFYENGNLIGSVTNSPYHVVWSSVAAGSYTLTAVATDNNNVTTTSAIRIVTVSDTGTPPTVSLSAPANNAVYVSPASLTVSAAAAAGDTNVAIAQVEFFANGSSIGVKTASPYSIAWPSPPAAVYTLTAVATDSKGLTTTSAARTVTVNATNTPPTVTLNAPPNNGKYALPVTVALSATASPPETNDTVAKVDFYANTTLIGTVTTSPYNFSWVNPAAGSYTITAVATDGFGATTTSNARAIIVAGTASPPTVSLSAPANSAVYVAPSSITVSANAAAGDTNVSIAQVQFFANGNPIGTKTAAPYGIAWASPAPGVYALTAVATDSLGTSTASAARTVTVNATNTPPTITLNAPPSGAKYVLPFTVPLSATASPPEANDTVAKVDFYANTTLIGTVTTSPYNFSWVNPAAGSYTITAVATDGFGATTTSNARAITVANTATPPTVSLTAPANAAIYVAPSSITVSASAAAGDTNISIAQVQFFANGNLIGTKTAAPYTIAWAGPAPGTYALTAVATDSAGDTTTSAARTITVNATNTPPTITLNAPPSGAKYVLPFTVPLSATATPPEANDTVTQVQFFANGTLIGTVTTSPYNFSWVNPAAGSYTITAVATDGFGATTTSNARSITVSNTANPPTVSLTAPANAAIYVAPSSITVSASAVAGDTNLSIAQVQFFANGTSIGVKTAAPYSVAWTSPAPGTYSLTAVATDSAGGTMTSLPRTVTINATNTPPTITLNAPPNNGKYALPVTVALSAVAAAPEANDTVTQVQFFANTTLIGTVTTSPYNFNWVNPAAGSYSITAVATDGFGATTTSNVRAVTVNNAATPPTVSLTAPANAGVYVEPVASITVSANAAAGDTNLTITQVQFLANGTSIGVKTAAPYSIAWTSPAPATYSLTAVATDSAGNTTTSAARTVTVNANNTPPTVSLTAPANNAKFTTPVNITVTATASPPEVNDTVAQVQFFANGGLIGTATAAPYSILWNNAPGGTYSLTAVATDGFGATTTSAARAIAVDIPPTVSLAANPMTALAPANVALSATAAAGNTGGTIAKVVFLQGATVIATFTKPPYTFNVTNLAAGTYIYTAQATDNLGVQTTSAPVTVTVNTNQPPTVNITAPLNGATFIAPATIPTTANPAAPNGSVAKVDFYQGTTLIGTATSAPYTITWGNVAQGAYLLTAKVTDNFGISTTSSTVAVTVNANQPPTITITSPANNSSFTAPANITITANATAPNGNVAKVDFFQGTMLLGTVTSAPYTFAWNNVASGTYQLTAKVTDNFGFATTSAAVGILVNNAVQTMYFIHADQLNTPRLITDQTNTPAWQWDNVDPFGANAPNQDPNGTGTAFVFNPRFPGQYFDSETGLYYNLNRHYDPATGRYIESDPSGLSAGINLFGYVSGNPLSLADSTGLTPTIDQINKCYADPTCGAAYRNFVAFGEGDPDTIIQTYLTSNQQAGSWCIPQNIADAISNGLGGLVGGLVSSRGNPRVALATGALGAGVGYATSGRGQGGAAVTGGAAGFGAAAGGGGWRGVIGSVIGGVTGNVLSEGANGGMNNTAGGTIGGAMGGFVEGLLQRAIGNNVAPLSGGARGFLGGAAGGLTQDAVNQMLTSHICPCKTH